MEPANEAPPPQQGCNLVNLVGCLLVPAGVYLGVRFGYHAYAWLGGIGGAVAGAIAGVVCTPLVVFLLLGLVSLEEFLRGLIARVRGSK